MFSNEKFSLQLIEPQIIKIEIMGHTEIDEKEAKQIIEEAVKITNGKNYAVLFNANELSTINFEAREVFAKNKKRIAAAMTSPSLPNRLLGNFFINFHKPLSPSRFLANEKLAVVWLREQIKKAKD